MRIIIKQVAPSTIVVHANWTTQGLALWAELSGSDPVDAVGDGTHPFAMTCSGLASILGEQIEGEASQMALRLPTSAGTPQRSPHLAHAVGQAAHLNGAPTDEGDGEGDAEVAIAAALEIASWTVPTFIVAAHCVPKALEVLEERSASTEAMLVDESAAHGTATTQHVIAGDSLRYFGTASRFALGLLAQQRVVPILVQQEGGGLEARWQPWLGDKATSAKFRELVDAIPPAARAVADRFEHEPTTIVEDFIGEIVDSHVRRTLDADAMLEALEDWDRTEDAQVAWLSGLLGMSAGVEAVEDRAGDMSRTVRRWVAQLEDRGPGGEWHMLIRLHEPILLEEPGDLEAPAEGIVWTLSFHLQSAENTSLVIDAEDVWTLRTESASVAGRRVVSPRELLLKELGRASRLYPELERALDDPAPVGLELTTEQAYEFLREIRPILEEQGIYVSSPDWWDSPSARIGARLQLETPEENVPGVGSSASGAPRLGLQSLVGYRWNIAVGDRTLTLEEFERLAEMQAPLVRMDGQWVEVRPDDVRAALQFIHKTPGGTMRISEALRMAFASDIESTGVPILGIDATGWLDRLLNSHDGARMPIIEPPPGFIGTLRPYQLRGLSWMSFLDQIGLGVCLADDMGLGKTIQLLALLMNERHEAKEAGDGEVVFPTLLVVPMSIVSNWKREAHKFTPTLRVLIHHGLDRKMGQQFRDAAEQSDMVVTTYALAHRDKELLELIQWGRIVLDEAQNIKNPSAKQSRAVKSLEAPRRAVLTGTPLENRLTELWSIMEFCNPGLLGTQADFRRRFAIPVERRKNRDRGRQLRELVRPFILRRLKTDKSVISDLPPKVETKEFCTLTPEQVDLYESCVNNLLEQVNASDGIKRRGLVLTSLVRLKQACNHPALLPGVAQTETPLVAARSGKCIRLIEMLDEVLAADAQALIFTQFRQMGHLLTAMLRQTFDRDVLFFHGGTPAKQREKIVEMFQKGDGSNPVLILSLKAGGVGLNLTAASHVFHFDRWWNPAVENQATDRAFRIGQTKTVNVHKFIVSGTLEDRIDQMIESKIALAEDIIGSGEDWLTELSVTQLQDMLKLRPDAFCDAPE